jgi:hypothetical protein
MEKLDDIFDLISYRNHKQQQAETNAFNLYSLAMEYAVKNSNIREKVRAKHLFRQQLSIKSEELFPGELEDFFNQWFLFDYQTIVGETMFSLFLKQQPVKWTEPEMILGALFLTSYIEPFEVLESNQVTRTIIVKNIMEEKIFTIINEDTSYEKGTYVCLRKLPLVAKDWAVGSHIFIQTKEVISQVVETFQTIKIANPSLTWRSFLKKQGYFRLL